MQFTGVIVFLFVMIVVNSYSFATDAGPAKTKCVKSLDQLTDSAALAFIKDVKKAKSAKAEAVDIIKRAAAESKSKKIAQTLPPSIDVANSFQNRMDINLKSLLQENDVSLSKTSYRVIESFAVNKNLNRVVLVPHQSTNRYDAAGVMVARIHQSGKVEFLNWIAKPTARSGDYSQPEFIGDSNILRVTKETRSQIDIQFFDLAHEGKELNSLSEILNLNFSKAIAFSETVYLVEVAETHEIIIFEYDPRSEKTQLFHKAQPSSDQTIQEIFNKRHNISAQVINNVLKLKTPEMTVVVDPVRNMVVPNRIKDNADTTVLFSPKVDFNLRTDLTLSTQIKNYTVGISPIAESNSVSINGTMNLVIIPQN